MRQIARGNSAISERMVMELQTLYRLCFTGNAQADTVMKLVDVKFVMPNTSNILHYNYAHIFGDLADLIGDYGSDRNIYVLREAIPGFLEEPDTLMPMFEQIHQFMLDLEEYTGKVMDLAIREEDKQTLKFLDKFMRKLRPLTALTFTLIDLVEMYGDTPKDWMQLDSNINKVLGIKHNKK